MSVFAQGIGGNECEQIFGDWRIDDCRNRNRSGAKLPRWRKLRSGEAHVIISARIRGRPECGVGTCVLCARLPIPLRSASRQIHNWLQLFAPAIRLGWNTTAVQTNINSDLWQRPMWVRVIKCSNLTNRSQQYNKQYLFLIGNCARAGFLSSLPSSTEIRKCLCFRSNIVRRGSDHIGRGISFHFLIWLHFVTTPNGFHLLGFLFINGSLFEHLLEVTMNVSFARCWCHVHTNAERR